MALGRNTRHTPYCRRSSPTLLPASQESWLTEQCLSCSIWHLHLTMWTINNCSIVSSTPTCPQQSVAGSTNICRTDEPKFILGKKNLKTGVAQGEVLSPALFNYYLDDFPTLPPNIKLIKYADDITIYTFGSVVADLINGLNIYLSQVLNYIPQKKLTVSTTKSIVTLHTRYSRAPPTSASEVVWPSTTIRKEAKSVRSDARHPSHFHTKLQQYHSNNAAT